ncbi:MAG: hypothetical protein M0D55_00505 [Elusimicrobiota bacterium]|nr:MAG: hypothetical protein M0D55_00505 [Elusimicrobiota bacterium]
MKTLIIAVILAALAVTSHAQAQEAKKTGWGDFFKNLKNSLSQSAVSSERKRGRNAQGVAAVRGDDQSKKNFADPNEPGLKGDAKSAKVRREMAYDQELEAAIDLVNKGKLDESLKALENFKTAHPKHKTADVDKAIEGVKAMQAEKAAAPAAQ